MILTSELDVDLGLAEGLDSLLQLFNFVFEITLVLLGLHRFLCDWQFVELVLRLANGQSQVIER